MANSGWSSPSPAKRVESKAVSPDVLGQPLRLKNGVSLRNRFGKAAMGELLAPFTPNDPKQNGLPTAPYARLFEKFGDGGYGIIATGAIATNPANVLPGSVIFHRDLDSAERRAAVEAWVKSGKKGGAFFVAQLFHFPSFEPGKEWNATTVPRQELDSLVENLVWASRYAYENGFDGVEFAFSYFFPLGSLLSAAHNKRTDEYGGSLEKRTRIIFDIVTKIR